MNGILTPSSTLERKDHRWAWYKLHVDGLWGVQMATAASIETPCLQRDLLRVSRRQGGVRPDWSEAIHLYCGEDLWQQHLQVDKKANPNAGGAWQSEKVWAMRWRMKVPQTWLNRVSDPKPSGLKSSVLQLNQTHHPHKLKRRLAIPGSRGDYVEHSR